MADIFISYSRKDIDFVRQLVAELTTRDVNVWIDWEDISPTTEWWQEITEGIDGAHTFLFVISPDSLASPVCHLEIAHAKEQNKRFIPIVRIEVEEKDAFAELISKHLSDNIQATLGNRDIMSLARENWQEISRHNWLFLQDHAQLPETVKTVIETMNTDFDYVRQHTQLLLRAREWAQQDQQPDFLLKGLELKRAAEWLQNASDKEPAPASLHKTYIATSQRLFVRRRLQTMILSTLLIGISAIFGAVIVIRLTASPAESEPMTGLFNIAVVTFGEVQANGDIQNTAASDLLSTMLLEEVERGIDTLPEFESGEIQIRHVRSEPIQGRTDKEQVSAAAAIAEEYYADVVVYGTIEVTSPQADLRSPNAILTPNFYISPNLAGANEISGEDAFGEPIPINLRIENDAQNRATLKTDFIPRIEAMAQFLYGLAFFKVDLYELSLNQFGETLDVNGWADDQGKEIVYLWVGTLFERAHLFEYAGENLRCPVEVTLEVSEYDYLNCASAAYEQAIRLNANFTRAYLGLGNIHYDLATLYGVINCGEYIDAAIPEYQKALNFGAETQPLIDLKAYYSIGLTYQTAFTQDCHFWYPDVDLLARAVTQLTRAENIYQANQDNPEALAVSAGVHFQLGLVYTRQGDGGAALAAYDKVIERAEPIDPAREEPWQEIRWFAHYRKANILRQMAQAANAADAESYWQQTLTESQLVIAQYKDETFTDEETVSSVYFFAGQAHAALGETDDARLAYESSLSIADDTMPYYHDTQQALDELSS